MFLRKNSQDAISASSVCRKMCSDDDHETGASGRRPLMELTARPSQDSRRWRSMPERLREGLRRLPQVFLASIDPIGDVVARRPEGNDDLARERPRHCDRTFLEEWAHGLPVDPRCVTM